MTKRPPVFTGEAGSPYRCILHHGPHQDGTAPLTICVADEAVETLSKHPSQEHRCREIGRLLAKRLDRGGNRLSRAAKREEPEEKEDPWLRLFGRCTKAICEQDGDLEHRRQETGGDPSDTFITDWDAKFHYNFWRPVTAIRNGDIDGNDATERDAGWTPLNVTPMHPEYPSQAAIQSGAAIGVLESVFGPGPVPAFTATDTNDPRLQRQFTSLAQMAEEQRMVRVWGGIHFRNTLEVSDQMGQKIAAYLLATCMTPVR